MNSTLLPTVEKVNTFIYILTEFNSEGWADAKKHLPIPFDLVTVRTNTDKKIAAWWNEHRWEGLRLKNTDVVIEWQRKVYEQF